MFLPPYSPDFDRLRKADVDTLKAAIATALDAFTPRAAELWVTTRSREGKMADWRFRGSADAHCGTPWTIGCSLGPPNMFGWAPR